MKTIRAIIIEPIQATISRMRTRRRNEATYRTLKHAFHGMTLNSMGKLYGVKRIQGESNSSYERRLLNHAKENPPKIERGVKR